MPDNQAEVRRFITGNHPWLLVSLLVFMPLFFDEQTRALLQYQRLAILDGQMYRLLSGHLVHTNLYHTLLNLAALVLIGLLSARHLKAKDWWLGLLIIGLVVSTCLIMFDPQLQWYRGLSGVLHGMVVVLVLKARQLAVVIRVIILAGIAIKLILEQTGTSMTASEHLLGAPVMVDAHLYGAVGGVLAFLVLHLTRSRRMFRENF